MPNPCPTTRMQGGFAAKFVESFKLLPYAFVGTLRVTVPATGTPVQFSQQSVPADMCMVAGDSNNAGICMVGSQDVRAVAGSERGLPVVAGANDPIKIYINDLSLLWADAAVNGDDVVVIYFRY